MAASSRDTLPDEVVYTLKYPVELAEELITKVTIGRIKGKHLRALGDANSPSMDDVMALAAKVMGESSVLLDEMDAEDVVEVCEIVGKRLKSGRRTGRKA
jgi:hypothetical protein